MKINTAIKYAVKQDRAQFSKFTGWITAKMGMALMAAGLLLAPSAAKAADFSMDDKAFILAAAQGGMTEVKLGELAAQKGLREDVKAFGQMMVKDHTAINDDLKVLAAKKDVTLPDSLDAKHQGKVDKMTALTGSDFDDAYIAGMMKGHLKDAQAFKEESAATKDVEVKSFVDKSIPVVEAHLQQITAMKK